MAETLGSLVDKLSIKNLRLWHLDEVLETTTDDDPKRHELLQKRQLVVEQQQDIIEEINGYLIAALEGKIRIRDEKVKLYKNLNVKSSDSILSLGKAVSELAHRNIKIWHLEDEVRREDLPDSEIVGFKRQIDTTNQERNDLMDKVDELLAKEAENRSRK